MIAWYQEWRRRRRAQKEARLLLREARRGLRKYAHRLTEKGAGLVKGAIDALDVALDKNDHDGVSTSINELDRALDDHMPFARKSTAREYAESIAVAVLIALFLRAFVVEAFKIPSGSMIPTLQVGDHIFVNKFIYGVRVPWTNIKFGMNYRQPRRGEVIVFIYPKEPDKDFIKRIIAIPGDTIEMKDNHLIINGKPVPREHVNEDCKYEDFDENRGMWEERRCDRWEETLDGNTFTTVYDRSVPPHSWPLDGQAKTIGPDEVFVMGDNRDNSHDSRFWGTVPYDLIKGKAMIIWWSSGEPEGWIRVARMFHLVH
jgi:signal peptidase I